MFILCSLAVAAPSAQLEVDTFGGGLGETALILTARHGVASTFEGVPRTAEGINVRQEMDAKGISHPTMIYPELRFTYYVTDTPQQAAQAALDAWNALPVDAHYRLVESHGILHFVPFEARTPDGNYVPFHALLDTPLHLDRTTGTVTHLYRDLLAKLVAATGVPIDDGCAGELVGQSNPQDAEDWSIPQQSDVTLPTADGTARDLLDDLLVAGNEETNWVLIWVVSVDHGRGGWRFGWTTTTPDHEWMFNGTPIVPGPK